MKAIVQRAYGPPDVLNLEEWPKPVPGPTEVLVKVEAASLNAYDRRVLRADPITVRFDLGWSRPKYPVPGADMAGQVEAIGKEVTEFRVGDRVFGDLAGAGNGALAEYAVAPESELALIPDGVSYTDAASAPMAACTALLGLRDGGHVRPGMSVLIHGASGGVGTYAVQVAKLMGAEVTAVCSTGKMELARQLGADHVIDYTREDFTRNGQLYDVILGVNGDRSLSDYLGALKPGGVYVMAGGSTRQIFEAVLTGSLRSLGSDKRVAVVNDHPTVDDLRQVGDWLARGELTPVIDRCYPLAETADALRYLEEGHARGKIVVTMNGTAT